jgi:heptosyltransferase III
MRILFITSNRIGDAVLTTGLLAWLVERFPEARFTIVCGPVAVDLFRAVPRLDRVIVLAKKKWNAHWVGLWRECKGERWDVIVDLRNSVVSRLLPAKKRYHRWRRSGRHKVIDNAAALGIDPPPPPTIWTDAKADEMALRLVPESLCLPSRFTRSNEQNQSDLIAICSGAVLALGPSANWAAKQWPAERFAELALKLTAGDGPLPGARVLIAAAMHERAQLGALFDALPADRIVDAVGYDLLAVSACLRRCRLYVGNDSGLTHVAAAVHVPTLALFGPGNPDVYRPWGTHAAFVRTKDNALEMDKLSVEEVYGAVKRLLNR